MRYLLFFCFCFLFLHTSAQVKPIYFDGDKITPNKEKATSYAIYGKLSTEDLWIVKKYDLWDNLTLTGSYKDEELKIAQGTFTFYAFIDAFNYANNEFFKISKGKERFVSQKGQYIDGLQQGRWFTYYPDGNVFSYQDFVDGKAQGEFKIFDKLGNVLTSGNYLDGQTNGEWFFDKGTKRAVFENGVLKSTENVKKKKKVKATVNQKLN